MVILLQGVHPDDAWSTLRRLGRSGPCLRLSTLTDAPSLIAAAGYRVPRSSRLRDRTRVDQPTVKAPAAAILTVLLRCTDPSARLHSSGALATSLENISSSLPAGARGCSLYDSRVRPVCTQRRVHVRPQAAGQQQKLRGRPRFASRSPAWRAAVGTVGCAAGRMVVP